MNYLYGAIRVRHQYFARVWTLNDDGTTTVVWQSTYGWSSLQYAEMYAESYVLPLRQPDDDYRLCRGGGGVS